MEYLRKSGQNILFFLFAALMAYFSSRLVLNYPGMSVSKWIFGLGPVVAAGIIMAVIKICSHAGYNVSTFFGFSQLNLNTRVFLAASVLAAVTGLSVIYNPFDFIMPVFILTGVLLFVLSVYMIIAHRMVDAVGVLLLSLPFITYFEDQLVRWETRFSFEWISIETAIIVLFVSAWVLVNVLADRKPMVKGKFNTLLLIFIIATFFSSIFSAEAGYSMKRWLFEILYPISFFYIILNSIRNEEDITRLLFYIVTGVTLYLILVLYYFAKYGGSNPLLDDYLLHLSFADGVLIANVVIMVVPIMIAFLVTAHTKGLKLLFCAMIFIGMVALILSSARMALMCMTVGLLAFGLIKEARKYLMLVIAAGLLIFVFSAGELAPYSSRYKGLTSLDSIIYMSSMEKRYGGWKAAVSMFKDNPVFGVGVGRFSREYDNYGNLYYSNWAQDYVPMNSAHNIYLNYLAETGIAGALLILAIFSIIMVKISLLFKRADKNRLFKYSLLISLAVFMVNNLVDGITFGYVKYIDKGLIFWSIAAIIMSYGIIEKNKGNDLPDNNRI